MKKAARKPLFYNCLSVLELLMIYDSTTRGFSYQYGTGKDTEPMDDCVADL